MTSPAAPLWSSRCPGSHAGPRRTTAALRAVAAAAGALLCASPAWAADGGAGPSEGLLLAEIAVLVLFARGLGELMLRLGQPAVMGHLLAGIVLGPSVFGLVWPAAQHL